MAYFEPCDVPHFQYIKKATLIRRGIQTKTFIDIVSKS